MRQKILKSADNDLPPLAVIQMMQKDWNRIAQLIELNLPAAKHLNTVTNASRSPTPMQVTQGLELMKGASTATASTEDIPMAAALLADQSFPETPTADGNIKTSPNREVLPVGAFSGDPTFPAGNNERLAASATNTLPAGDDTKDSNGDATKRSDGNATKCSDGDGTTESSTQANQVAQDDAAKVPDGMSTHGVVPDVSHLMNDPGSPLTADDDSVVGLKRKHNDKEEPKAEEKKKRKALVTKKCAAGKWRAPRGKTADPTHAGDEKTQPEDGVEG